MSDTTGGVRHVPTKGPGKQALEGAARGFSTALGGGPCEVVWDETVRATGIGGLIYFGRFLGEGGLFDKLVATCPLRYASNNAPPVRAVLATAVTGIVAGARRYAHLSRNRGDALAAEMLGADGLVSEDSVRRALARSRRDEPAWDRWLTACGLEVVGPLLAEPYVLDVDTSVLPLYGRQEGADVSYNPAKRGRPSHAAHTAFVGALRLVFSVDVQRGANHGSRHMAPALWAMIDGLPPGRRPSLIRGDTGFGNEPYMCEAEARGIDYLFKLRKTSRARALVRQAAGLSRQGWAPAGDGWETCEARLRLTGWSRERRVVVARRRAPAARAARADRHPELALAGEPERMRWEYSVLVTGGDLPAAALVRLYCERADCENVFDEMKNQWGLGGFTTQDLARCRVTARLVALVCNWWNVFARLGDPLQHREALTSRPALLNVIAQAASHGGRTVLRLCSHHGAAREVREAFARMDIVFSRLGAIAEQLGAARKWAVLLSLAFVKWLRGRVLDPAVGGDPVLRPLLVCGP